MVNGMMTDVVYRLLKADEPKAYHTKTKPYFIAVASLLSLLKANEKQFATRCPHLTGWGATGGPAGINLESSCSGLRMPRSIFPAPKLNWIRVFGDTESDHPRRTFGGRNLTSFLILATSRLCSCLQLVGGEYVNVGKLNPWQPVTNNDFLTGHVSLLYNDKSVLVVEWICEAVTSPSRVASPKSVRIAFQPR